MSDWQAESLRVTAFTKPPTDPAEKLDGRKIWQTLTGADPDRSNRDPRTLSSEDAGIWQQDIWLIVRVAPGRVDVVLAPVPAELLTEPPAGIPNMGRFDDRRSTALQAGAKLLDVVLGIVRIAFGAVLLLPAADHQDGYTRLSRYLPGVKFGPGMEEFVYQVNRPRTVTPEPGDSQAFLINRLGKWSVMKMSQVLLFVQGSSPGLAVPSQITLAGHSQVTLVGYACRAEFDLSTDAGRSDLLPAERVQALFTRLVEASVDLAEHGDVAEQGAS